MSGYKLSPLSDEQKQIVDSVLLNKNVIIDSVAGSGKTTTSLHICSSLPDKNILILTYNSKLKIESREKVKLLGLKNVEVHSYHAFCVKYYTKQGFRDAGIQYTIVNKLNPTRAFTFDIIILDEQQDMTKLFYNFSKEIMDDNMMQDIQICSFGDIYQNIYTYAGSDSRYLTFANRIFNNYTSRQWDYLKISTSYRITRQMADFININLLKSERLKAVKDGPKVKYVITNTFSETYAYTEIIKYLKQGYSPDDIFVLAVSLKKGNQLSPINRLENKLAKAGVPVLASLTDDTKIDDDVIKGKLCFASFCQVKGMERKICFVYGFDESYFSMYARDADRNVCPNVLYVALTRASERLVVLHDCSKDYMPFMDEDTLKDTCEFIEHRKFVGGSKPSDAPRTVAVRDLIKNISNDSINYIFNIVKYKQINPPNKHQIQLKSKVLTKNNLHEDVTDINGLTIPSLYEYGNTGKISMMEQIMAHINNKKTIDIMCANMPENYQRFIQHAYQQFSHLPDDHRIRVLALNKKYLNKTLDTPDMLYLSIVYNSLLTGFIGKREQIVNYDWFDKKDEEDALKIISKYISNKAEYEKTILCMHGKIIVGVVDVVDIAQSDTIFELKCTSELSKEHILQLVIYSYIYEKTTNNNNMKKVTDYMNMLNSISMEQLKDVCKYEEINDISNDKQLLIDSLVKKKIQTIESQKRKIKYKLLNILTEEIIEVEYDEKYGEIIDYLMNAKDIVRCSDDMFLELCIGNDNKDNNNNENNDDNDNNNDDNDDDDSDGFMFV
jgi:hypothetical protein